jgi:hypothetical protein
LTGLEKVRSGCIGAEAVHKQRERYPSALNVLNEREPAAAPLLDRPFPSFSRLPYSKGACHLSWSGWLHRAYLDLLEERRLAGVVETDYDDRVRLFAGEVGM